MTDQPQTASWFLLSEDSTSASLVAAALLPCVHPRNRDRAAA